MFRDSFPSLILGNAQIFNQGVASAGGEFEFVFISLLFVARPIPIPTAARFGFTKSYHHLITNLYKCFEIIIKFFGYA